MPSWSGKHIWIWQPWRVHQGDAQTIAAAARQLGLTGVIVKYHDGGYGRVSDQYRQHFERLAPALQAAGLVVGAWGYSYGNQVQEEVELAVTSLARGADWYVLDAETEYENRPELARVWCEAFRQRAPRAVLGVTPFAIPSLHPRYPYRDFDRYVDAFLPQVYWGYFPWGIEESWQRFDREFRVLNLRAAIAPIGQATDDIPPQELRRFGQLVREGGYPGLSFWSWQHAGDAQLAAIAAVPTPNPGPFPDVPADHWAAAAVRRVAEAGLMSGYPDGTFRGEYAVSRYELASALARLLERQS